MNIGERLYQLGWITEAAPENTISAFDGTFQAVLAYADFFAIAPGEVEDHIANRCCMVPDRLVTLEANIPQPCRFDYGLVIRVDQFSERLFGLPQATFEDTFARACQHWNERIGINLHVTTDFAAAKCAVGFESLGGSTLAWSHLANDSCKDDKIQKYDQPRQWTIQQLYLTIIHELGHLLGLGHGGGIMSPTINMSLSGTTNEDITRARNLGYGPPVEPDEPPKPEPEPIPVPVPIDVGQVVDALLGNAEFIRAVTGPKGDSPKIDYTRIENDVMQRILSDPEPFKGPKGDPGGLDHNAVVALGYAKTAIEQNAGVFRWPGAARGFIDAINKALGK